MFSDIDIKQAVESGELFIEGLKEESIQPASIDLHLGDKIILTRQVDKYFALDMYSEEDTKHAFTNHVDISGALFRLESQQFILAATERVRLGNELVAQVAGKSSVARDGIEIESAGFIDPGFDGCITLEIYNKLPFAVYLTPGQPIAQLAVTRLDTPSSVTYKGKYQGADGPQASRYYLNERPQ